MAVTVTIRRFRAGDADAIADLVQVCLRTVNSRDYPPEIIDRMCAHHVPSRIVELAAQRQMFVAETAAEGIAGTVSREGNKVHTMFVRPGLAGRGIGRQLMRHIESLAAGEGHDHMEAGASITGHGFYQRLGYVDVRTSESEFGVNLIMRLPLG
jgi:GNAT superfamily N-acetyltransferase